MAAKWLLCAFEKSGKSTITSQIKDALVINFDQKEYGFKTPHVNIKDFIGMDNLISTINEKIEAYNTRFGEYPSTVVFDTVTQLYMHITRYAGNNFKGFDQHNYISKATLDFNAYIEQSIIGSGISVVIVAHTNWDEATARHTIPASGAFQKAGSWLSVVNDSSFIEVKGGKLVVHHSNMRFPCRTTLTDIPPSQPIEEFDVNEFLDKLASSKLEADDYLL